jgi:hypothetical protein
VLTQPIAQQLGRSYVASGVIVDALEARSNFGAKGRACLLQPVTVGGHDVGSLNNLIAMADLGDDKLSVDYVSGCPVIVSLLRANCARAYATARMLVAPFLWNWLGFHDKSLIIIIKIWFGSGGGI